MDWCMAWHLHAYQQLNVQKNWMRINRGRHMVIIKYSSSQSHHWSHSSETAVLITVEHYHVQQLNKKKSSSQEMSGWFRMVQSVTA